MPSGGRTIYFLQQTTFQTKLEEKDFFNNLRNSGALFWFEVICVSMHIKLVLNCDLPYKRGYWRCTEKLFLMQGKSNGLTNSHCNTYNSFLSSSTFLFSRFRSSFDLVSSSSFFKLFCLSMSNLKRKKISLHKWNCNVSSCSIQKNGESDLSWSTFSSLLIKLIPTLHWEAFV